MSLEFILQLADSTCHNCLSSGLIDRDPDSFLSTSRTYEDGWKLLLHDTYYTTPSTTQNTLSSCFSEQQRVPPFRYLPLVQHPSTKPFSKCVVAISHLTNPPTCGIIISARFLALDRGLVV